MSKVEAAAKAVYELIHANDGSPRTRCWDGRDRRFEDYYLGVAEVALAEGDDPRYESLCRTLVAWADDPDDERLLTLAIREARAAISAPGVSTDATEGET